MATSTPVSVNGQPSDVQADGAMEQGREGRRGTGGGYDCEFRRSPPRIVQTECSICLLVLREPHITSCCGHSFCRTCIGDVMDANMNCPLCNGSDFTLMHNKGLERSLKELEVHCSHQRLGCEWTGELGALESHLNTESEPEKRQEGCGFVTLDCIHSCGERIQRQRIAEHQGDECLKRPYSCDFCHQYESTFEDVVSNHYPVCTHYLISCPNCCTPYTFERQSLGAHLDKDCPLQVTNCELAYAGCDTRLPRRDMPGHAMDSCVSHLSLLSALNLKQAQELQERNRQFQALQEETQNTIGVLKSENEKLRQQTQNLALQVKQCQREVESIYHQCNIVPVQLVMTSFTEHKEAGRRWFSKPFYTHWQGYKMCLKVDATGVGSSKGTHISVFLHLMKGEFDDRLKWPFVGDVTLHLLNQAEDANHCTETVSFTEVTPGEASHRVLKGERGLGWTRRYQFVTHSGLIDLTRGIQYLRDDNLYFRIAKVRLK